MLRHPQLCQKLQPASRNNGVPRFTEPNPGSVHHDTGLDATERQ